MSMAIGIVLLDREIVLNDHLLNYSIIKLIPAPHPPYTLLWLTFHFYQ